MVPKLFWLRPHLLGSLYTCTEYTLLTWWSASYLKQGPSKWSYLFNATFWSRGKPNKHSFGGWGMRKQALFWREREERIKDTRRAGSNKKEDYRARYVRHPFRPASIRLRKLNRENKTTKVLILDARCTRVSKKSNEWIKKIIAELGTCTID